MKGSVLKRLLTLRRKHEQRALETLVARRSAFRRAEAEAAHASHALTHYQEEAAAREQQLIDALLGQPVRLTAIAGLQDRLDTMAFEAAQLRDVERQAQTALEERKGEVDAAQTDFRRRRQAAAKLDLMVKEHTARGARRRTALAEAADEDQNADRGRSPHSHPHRS